MKQQASLLGSTLTIDIDGPGNDTDIRYCFDVVREFEAKYSRFIEGSYLSDLNTDKNSDIDPEFFSILKLCLKVSDMTDGYFDITLLPLLENAGYGIAQHTLEPNMGYKNIELSQNTVTLHNRVSIDIGAVGKGYMIDKIYRYLEGKYERFIIDFGGDIRVKGSYRIGLEDPGDSTQRIGSIDLKDLSIASSSGNRRKFGTSHHLMNPKTGKSVDDKKALFVTHRLSCFSDIFSTALFVAPIDISLSVLNCVPGLEAMIMMQDGSIHTTKNFICQM